ncbi:MAG TPA: hypothetical protein VHB98_08550 [Chloroflexota bacterium]|jgi:hypothetical protein|nr:hypothetical protein [Chloroflexota bacterium]
MTPRWTHLAATSLLLGGLVGGSALSTQARVSARTAGANSTATPSPTPTPAAGTSPTATAITTPTPQVRTTFAPPHKPINPTPIPSHRTSITLPKPVVVVVGTKTLGSGLSQQAAFRLANNPKNLVSFLIAPPSYVPKNYILEFITATPAQDQQTPAAVALQYIPKGLSKVSGTYPSVTLYKQLGQNILLVNPGGKVQIVTIRAGNKGVGVVKGRLIDIKFKNSSETVEIAWQVNSINYELTSVVSLSRLSVHDLLAMAGSFQ